MHGESVDFEVITLINAFKTASIKVFELEVNFTSVNNYVIIGI